MIAPLTINLDLVVLRSGDSREADISTEQAGAQAPSRVPHPHGHQGWPQSAQRAPRARPQAPQRLIGCEAATAARMQRLKQRSDFVAATAGAKVHGAGFVLQTRERGDDRPARVGFTVSRKVGNAVERNRVRRRLREIVRLAAADRIPDGHDYVLVGRRAALEMSFERLVADFTGALRRVKGSQAAP
jgi:ribonuclease P protein component